MNVSEFASNSPNFGVSESKLSLEPLVASSLLDLSRKQRVHAYVAAPNVLGVFVKGKHCGLLCDISQKGQNPLRGFLRGQADEKPWQV